MSSKIIINPESLDYEDIYQDIEDHIEAAPESARWKDKFNNSAGNIIKEIVAGNALFKRREAIISKREAFWLYARERSSVIGGAQFKGYSVFRGTNVRISATIIPNFTGVLPRLSTVGTVLDEDIILLENTVFIAGEAITIPVTVGVLKEESITVPDDRPNVFRFTRTVVSEDIELGLNGTRVNTTRQLVEIGQERFAVITNPFGSVDVFYTNDELFSTRYQTGDKLTLIFVNTSSLVFELSDLEFSIGDASNILITQNRREEESIDTIKVNAPIYSETQYVVRSREDYAKIFRLLDSNIVSTDYENVSPMVVRLFYVRGDGILFTPSEKSSLLDRLILNRNMGLEPPLIDDPIRGRLKLAITVTTSQVSGTLLQDIDDILNRYNNLLGVTVDFIDIENQIEQLSNVRIARVEISSEMWQAQTRYETEFYVSPSTPNGFVYRVDSILRFSGNTEPSWPTTLDQTVTDGELVWRCKYLERQCDPNNPQLPLIPPRDVWESSKDYKLGDIVIPTVLGIFEYELVGFVNRSSGVEPTWPALGGGEIEDIVGQTVFDNRLIWRAIPLEGTPSDWSPNTTYEIGTVVVATDPQASDTEGVMFQLIGIAGQTGTTEPTWPTLIDEYIDDGSIRWQARLANQSPRKLNPNRYLSVERTITLV